MSKKPRIVYTQSTGNKCEYNIYSVETKECLGKTKGDNNKSYWEAFDTSNNFLMSGKRKKECMDYFREMDTKRLMAKGGGMDFEKLSNKVAKNYEGDKVAPKYQHEYGKTYSKAEAKEVGDKVAGKVYWQQQGRMAKGGGIEKKEEWYIKPKGKSSLDNYKTWGVSPLVVKIKNSKGEKGFFGFYKLMGFSEKAFGNFTYWLVPFAVNFRVIDEEKRIAKWDWIVKEEDVWMFNPMILKDAWIKADEINFDEWNFTKDQLEKYKIKNDAETDKAINEALLKYQNSFAEGGNIKKYEYSPSIEEQKTWDEKKSKIYDAYVNSYNTYEDLLEDKKRAEKRKDKDELKSIDLKLKNKLYTIKYAYSELTGFDEADEFKNGGSIEEYRAKAIERQRKEEEGKTFAQFRAFVYEGSDQFDDFKTDDFHKAVKWAKETLEKQRSYRRNSDNLWAIVDEFTPIEKRNNVIYAYSEVARFGEGDMKNMKFKNGGSMPSASKGFYIVLADGSKKEYSVNNITEIPNIYFAMGTNGIEKGTPMVHHDNILTSVYYANGTPVEAMPQYAGKDYYDFKKKMADGGNVAEDEDYYRVFRNNAGKDIAVKIVKNPIFGKFDYYVDGTLRGQFDTFAQARQEVNYENFDMYKDGGSIEKGNYAFVEAETTTGEKVFKFFEDVPTHKEVYAYFRSCKDKNGNPMTLKDATIHVEKVSNFDRELFLEKANEIAMNQFGSPIKELDDLMFAHDKESLSVFKFEAELENGMEVSIEATDGVIIIEAEKDDDDKKYKDGGEVEDTSYIYMYFDDESETGRIYEIGNKSFDNEKDAKAYARKNGFTTEIAELHYGTAYAKGGNLHSSEFYAKGGLVITSINDIPNFKEENEAGRITYRGLGMGKLSNDFYKIAGEGGTRIKVKGKEYFITNTEFNTFSRDSSGKMRIRFDAPFRKLR